MIFSNNTQLIAEPFILMNSSGAESLLIVVKGTWSIAADGTLMLSDEQMPIQQTPLYNGEPGTSSLRYDSDIVLEKPGTDCVLIGHAWAPRGASQVDVSFAVGTVRQQARVFGERKWVMNQKGAVSISKSSPFDNIPLTWEYAYGGADTSWEDPAFHEFCQENPVGRGFSAVKSNISLDAQVLPNIEYPVDLILKPGQRPRPVGFGMVAPYWQPRATYAGTYDENWRRNISPLPPADLDPRFYSSAAPGLNTLNHLSGTEQVVVEGASRQGILRFELPGIQPLASVRRWRNEDLVPLRLDTVIVEPEEERLILVWRGAVNIHGKVREISQVGIELQV